MSPRNPVSASLVLEFEVYFTKPSLYWNSGLMLAQQAPSPQSQERFILAHDFKRISARPGREDWWEQRSLWWTHEVEAPCTLVDQEAERAAGKPWAGEGAAESDSSSGKQYLASAQPGRRGPDAVPSLRILGATVFAESPVGLTEVVARVS